MTGSSKTPRRCRPSANIMDFMCDKFHRRLSANAASMSNARVSRSGRSHVALHFFLSRRDCITQPRVGASARLLSANAAIMSNARVSRSGRSHVVLRFFLSRRDCITQPRVGASARLPWVTPAHRSHYPEGVAFRSPVRVRCNPFRVVGRFVGHGTQGSSRTRNPGLRDSILSGLAAPRSTRARMTFASACRHNPGFTTRFPGKINIPVTHTI
jgi:hypothetical protein